MHCIIFLYKSKLFSLYFFENLCEKYGYSSDNHEEYYFANSREKYSSNTEYTGEKIHNKSYLRLRESELHESIMEMMCLISLHRVLSLEYTSRDHIDKIDEIESEYRHSGCDFPTCDDREGRYEECEHDSTRITHDECT